MSDGRMEIILAMKDLTQQAFGQVIGRVEALERKIFSVGGLLAGFGTGVGLFQVAKHAEQTAESFERLEAQLDILYRGRGKEVLEEINAWALDMPVNTQKAVGAWVQMRALGLDPTIERLQTLTDVATIFGEDVLSRLTLQLGQMSAKGKVMSQDLNIMAEAGVNARKYIMDAFGMTVEEIQNSGIEVEKIIEAIFTGMARDFGGSAQRMMTSWRGLKETAVSYLVEIERKVMDAGAFEAMKAGLSGLNLEMKTWLSQNDALLKQKVPEYTQNVISALKSLAETTAGLVGIFQALPDEITGAAGYGIIGRVVFGGWGPAKIVAGIALINNTLSDFGMGLGDLKRKNDEAGAAIYELGKSIYEVASGERHWWTGEYNEWRKAAAGASDFWARHKRGAEEYQEDIRRLIERDPLNDFFARNKAQMGHYTSPAGKIVRQIAQDAAKAAKEAEEAAKMAAAEIERSQKAVADAVADAQRKVWEGLGKELEQNNEAVRFRLREYRADLEKIRELGKQAYEAAGEDVHRRHRDLIGPYDAEMVKKNLEAIKNQEKEAADWSVRLNEYTLETIQDQFADFFDDLQSGEFKSFGDYVIGFFQSLGKAVNRIVAQWFTEELFGKAGGGSGMLGDLLGWAKGGAMSLFGSYGGGGGAPAGWENAWTHHTGGIAGDGTAPSRLVPAWAFAGAPRFHNGLAPDELAAIIKRDEGVFTPAQMKAMGGRSLSISVPVSVSAAGSGVDERRLSHRIRDGIEDTVRRVLREEMR